MKQHRRTPLAILILSALNITNGVCAAQDVKGPANQTNTSEGNAQVTSAPKTQQVEVTAKNEPEVARKDAAAKTVVSNAELIKYGDTNIADAMKRVPGVTVVKGVMQLPGMAAGYTQVLVDGEPPRGININDIPMNTIERVEIYRLGSAEFSSQAMAGTINIILKKVPRTAQQQLKTSITHVHNTTGSTEWMGSDKNGNLSYSLSLRASEFGFSFPQTTNSEEYDQQNQLLSKNLRRTEGEALSKQFFISPILQYKNDSGFSLRSTTSISGSNFEDHSSQDYQFIAGQNYPIQSTQSRTYSRGRNGNSSIKINDKIFDDAKLDFNLGVNGYTSDYLGHEVNYSKPEQLAFTRSTQNRIFNRGLSSSLKVTVPSTAEHDIVIGWNGSRSQNETHRTQVDIIPTQTSSESNLQTTESAIDNMAIFAQDEWKFRKNSSVYLGLRWEGVRVNSKGNTQNNAENTSSVWSPIVQTLWQLNDENTDRFRLGVSRTYNAPPNFYIISPKFVVVNNSIENPSLRGNPALKPELAWSLQTSFEHNDQNEFSYSVKAVVRKIMDIHRMQLSYADNTWWRQYVNAGEGISKVLSFETQFPAKRCINDAPNIDFSFYIGRTWSAVSYLPKPDNLLVPGKLNANVSIDYKTKDQMLSMGGSLRYQDNNPILISSLQRTTGAPSVDLDVYALWNASKKTKLRLSMDNLLKRTQVNTNQYFETQGMLWRSSYTKPFRYFRLQMEHSF